MTVGYSAAGTCWATAQEAIDGYYSSLNHSVAGSFDKRGDFFSTLFYYYKTGTAWYLGRVTCSSNSCVIDPGNLAMTNSVYGSCTMPEPAVYAGGAASTGSGYLPADFDYSVLGGVFAFALSVVLLMYVLGRSTGLILDLFRK